MLFGPPGWRPAYMGGRQTPPPVTADHEKYDVSVSTRARVYLTVQFVALMGPVALYLFQYASMSLVLKGSFATWVVCSTLLFAFLFESRHPGVRIAETGRLLCLLPGMWWLQQAGLIPAAIWPVVATAGFVAVSIVYVWRSYSTDGAV